jgi:hypothetical protein
MCMSMHTTACKQWPDLVECSASEHAMPSATDLYVSAASTHCAPSSCGLCCQLLWTWPDCVRSEYQFSCRHPGVN